MTINIIKIKEKLEAEKGILTEEMKSLGLENKQTGIWEAAPIVEEEVMMEADENDMADHDEDFLEQAATLRPLDIRLDEINDALEKIEKNNYGVCETCGEEIEEDRLEANPAARTCKKHL